ncbi:MAG: SDR family oxidoreductase [Phycisphaerae bacterium]|nr:SDR family oxidoreductase [Phycisphaerae bacterium]
MDQLMDRRALVCGSTQGIGRACAHELARLGAAVTLVARNEENLRQVRSELSTAAGQAHHYLCVDFVDPQALPDKVAGHIEAHGPIHILVNNTGGPPPGQILDADPQAFQAAFSQHLIANHLLTQAVVAGMKQAGFGRIINIISISVKQPIPGLGVSNTTRWAVASWAKTLAGELGPFGITVNNVLPGYTDTQRLRSLLKRKADQTGTTLEEIEAGIKAEIPARRFAAPEEIAAAVGFLASPAASYVNGINLPVDGGRTQCL